MSIPKRKQGERMYFLIKLLPPRNTFMQDMSPEEAAIMQKHVAYWRGVMEQGKVHAFGPVADPEGGWGLGILETQDRTEAEALCASDPAIVSGRGFQTKICVMPRLVLRG
jgi:uncharacterized protein YciI